MRKLIIILGFIFLSCSSKDSAKISHDKNPYEITKVDLAEVLEESSLKAADTLYPRLSKQRQPQKPPVFAPQTIMRWYAFMPYKDTLTISLDNIKRSKTILNNIYDKGYYLIDIGSVDIESGLYFLKIGFCDSVFTNKIILMR